MLTERKSRLNARSPEMQPRARQPLRMSLHRLCFIVLAIVEFYHQREYKEMKHHKHFLERMSYVETRHLFPPILSVCYTRLIIVKNVIASNLCDLAIFNIPLWLRRKSTP